MLAAQIACIGIKSYLRTLKWRGRQSTCDAWRPLTNQHTGCFMAKENLTAERLRELLHYDPNTGVFTWAQQLSPIRPVGSVAGSTSSFSYIEICIHGRRYYAHRLAFLWVLSEWPQHQVDHIDGDRANNKWNNLRDITNAENKQNRRSATKGSFTGLLGVSRCRDKFKAEINVPMVGRKHIGVFSTPEEAHAAYVEAKRRLHPYSTL
jgi:hypothetical protein